MTSPDTETIAKWSSTERRELYRILDINNKLDSHQVRLVERKTGKRAPPTYPPGTVSRMFEVRLAINDYEICRAHCYVGRDGKPITELDPKWFKIDNLIIKQ